MENLKQSLAVIFLSAFLSVIMVPAYLWAQDSDNYLYFTETNVLIEEEGEPTDIYSSGVATSRDYLAIGANRHGVGGSVYIYKTKFDENFGRNIWERIQIIQSNDAAGGDFFGNTVDLENDYLIVGAPGDDDVGVSSGSVYIFKRNPADGLFYQRQKILASDGGDLSKFGKSIKIKGDFLVIGAHGAWGNNYQTGATYIFRKNSNGNFDEFQKIFASDGESFDSFAEWLDFDGNKIIVSASFNDNNSPSESGSAYVFARQENSDLQERIWFEEQKIKAANPQQGDRFGRGVAIAGNRLVVGAGQEGFDTGAAYIFEFEGKSWEQKTKLVPQNGNLNDWFGWKVEISDKADRVFVTSPMDDNFGFNAGSLYIYSLNKDGVWEEKQYLSGSSNILEDNVGYNIDVDGGNIALGTLQVEYGTGKAYIFSVMPQIKEIRLIGYLQNPIADIASEDIHIPQGISLGEDTYLRLLRKSGTYRLVDQKNADAKIPGLRDYTLRNSSNLDGLEYALQLKQDMVLGDIHEYSEEIIFAADVNKDGNINIRDVLDFLSNPFDMDGDGVIEGGYYGDDTNAVRSWVE